MVRNILKYSLWFSLILIVAIGAVCCESRRREFERSNVKSEGYRRTVDDSDLLTSLIPDRDQLKLRRDMTIAGQLEETVETVNGVISARVHLTTEDVGLFSGNNRNPPFATVVAIVKDADSGRSDNLRSVLAGIVASAVGGLERNNVEVFLSAGDREEAPIECVPLGPVDIASDGIALARVIVGGLLAMCLALALGLIYAGITLRRLRMLIRPGPTMLIRPGPTKSAAKFLQRK